jgi:hypothetical protein
LGEIVDREAQYHIGSQLIAFVIIAPYISQSRWHDAFVPPQLHKAINPRWYVCLFIAFLTKL